MKFSALCPTRKRPHFMENLAESIFSTVSDKNIVELVFYIDDDDTSSIEKAKELSEKFNIQFIVGPRGDGNLSQFWNECYKICKGDYLFHCGDDILMRTKNWDLIVSSKFDEFGDKIAFVYGDDGNPGTPLTFGTHGFIHRKWAETVGYFVPPYFSSDWNDTWLNDVALLIDRHFFVDILTEHMHPGAHKYHYDETHTERLERGRRDNVQAMYNGMISKRVEDSEKLKKFIDEYRKSNS